MVKHTIIFLFFSFSSFAQIGVDTDIDPTPFYYEQVMNFENPTVEQFDTVWRVISLYYNVSLDTSKVLSLHAEKITENSPHQILYGRALYLKAITFKLDTTTYPILLKARKILKTEKDTTILTKVEMGLSNFHAEKSEWKQSIDYQLNAVRLLQAQKDSFNLANATTGIGRIYYRWGYIKRAVEYLDQSIAILEAMGKTNRLSAMLSNKANAYERVGYLYQSKADTAGANVQVYQDSAAYFYNKGLEDAERSLFYAKQHKNKIAQIAAMNVISNLQNSLGNFPEALKIALSASQKAKTVGNKTFISRTQKLLAKTYKNMGQYQLALQYAKADYDLNPTEEMEQELYEIYRELGQSDKALPILEKIKERTDKKYFEDTRKAFVEAETQFQTAEKQKQILVQENDILALEATNLKVEKQRNYLIGGGLLLALLGFFGYRINKIRQDRNDKKAFAEALIFAQEEERKRIARDLHDSVGQSLLLIIKKMDNNTEVVSENQKMIAQTLEEVRAISGDLHPFKLDKFGLTATVIDMVEKIKASTNIFISKELDNIDKVLPAKAEIHLFRTIQEAWNNIVKHSEATAAKISATNAADHVKIVVQDNGKGFDLELAIVKSKSLGIRTMHERILAIGGKLKIEEGQNGGTQLTITIPKKQ